MRIVQLLITVLLAACFAVATTGVSVVYHYCAGELDGIALFAGGRSCDCSDTAKVPQSCCKDEVAVHKLDAPCPAAASVTTEHCLLVVPLRIVLADNVWRKAESPIAHTPEPSPPYSTDIPIVHRSLLI